MDAAGQRIQPRVGLRGQRRAGHAQFRRDGGGEAVRQQARQQRGGLRPPALGPRLFQQRGDVVAGGEVQRQRLSRLPVAGNLQDHRAGKTAVGEQQPVLKGDGAAAGRLGQRGPRLDPDPRQRRGQAEVLFGEGQRHQPRPRVGNAVAGGAGDIIADTGRAHPGDRLAPGRDHDMRGQQRPLRGLHPQPLGVPRHPGDGDPQPQFCPAHAVDQHLHDLGGATVAEQLSLRLFVPGDAGTVDKRDETLGPEPGQRRGTEPRHLRQEAFMAGAEIGEIAPPPARDADLFARSAGVVQHHHPQPAPRKAARAEQSRAPRTKDDHIRPLHALPRS